MKNKKKLICEVLGTEYDFGTGIPSYMNKKLETVLNEYGEYKTYCADENLKLTNSEEELLSKVNCLLSDKNETDISKKIFEKIEGIKYDNNVGFYKRLYIGHVIEGDFRKNASSGGFGTWLFVELLKMGYIDSVIHVKPTGNNNKLFEYTISRTENEIIEGAKTKYYPVELSKVLDTVKDNDGKYAIIGIPSFIMELRLLAEVDSTINERIKFFIGLVCGHQKSSKFGESLAWQCGIEPGKLEYIDFRKKLDYGPSSSYAIEVRGEKNGSKQTIVKEMKNLYGADWGRGLFKVRASDFNDDIMNETADITLGDAWLPEYTSDNRGNNILVVRHPLIESIIETAIGDGRIKLDNVDANTIYRSQMSHYRHSRDELAYRLYKKKRRGKWIPNKRVKPSNSFPLFRKKIQDAREEICIKAPDFYIDSVKKNDFSYFIKKMSLIENKYIFYYKIMNLQGKLKKRLKKR